MGHIIQPYRERRETERGTLTVSCGSRAVHFQPYTGRIPIHSSKTQTIHTHTTNLSFGHVLYKAISKAEHTLLKIKFFMGTNGSMKNL